ncbi:MAG: hypothetical protein DMF77_01025 [Acidobacteria bacterium]|nr:MAG: hypothetical protein DMF77_01025 [Acidobacteriota bacterium]
MQEREWFYVEAGIQRGPHTAAELVEVVRRLGPGTLVWRAGLEGWVRAEAVLPPIPGAALPARDGEPHTLNPLVLWRRCFAWSGRFTRSEFAVAHLGFGLVGLIVVGAGAALMAAAGDKNKGAWIAIGLFALVWIPIAFMVSVGSTVRRLHDLGQSGWLALVSFVPCISLVFLVYLLAAAGRERAAPPASGTIPVGVLVAVVVALVLVVPMMIGIIAAIAIPSLLRARVAANEASAIGNVRTVISAQAAYQTVNQGFYDGRWECLSGPQACIPDYTGPTFIDAALFAGPRSGYVHELQGGARAAAAKGISPSSTDAFAVIAYPAAAGKTGVRAFCGDATGRVCAVASGSREELVAGSPGQSDIRCADGCRELR